MSKGNGKSEFLKSEQVEYLISRRGRVQIRSRAHRAWKKAAKNRGDGASPR